MILLVAASLTSATVALLLSLVTARLSVGPGWRELRWFSAGALLAALYGLGDVASLMAPTDGIPLQVARLQLAVGGLHGVAWFLYTAAMERRPLSRIERFMVRGSLALAAVSLVPGTVCFDAIAARPVPMLGVVYRDGIPTRVGYAVFSFFAVSMVWLATHHARRAIRGERYALAHAVGMWALVAAAVHDAAASSGLLPTPSLIDLGYLMVVTAVALAIAERFVNTARALEVSSAKLRDAQATLVQRERLAALGELSAVVAHEVRNPVAVIWNAVSSLRKNALVDADRMHLLQIVEEEGDRLRRMVEDLLALARPESLRREPVALEVLVREAAEAACAGLSIPASRLAFEIAPGMAPLVCDGRLVRQAVLNLVTNALQAAPNGSVRIAVRVDATFACVEISDEGAGVPEDNRDRLFTPFFTTRAQGTGLGLAIVRRVAEAHGGEASLEPAAKRGATFVLRLPTEVPGFAAAEG